MAKRSAAGEEDNIRPVFHQLLGYLPAHDLFDFPQFRREPHGDVLIGELADLTRGTEFSKTVEGKHDIRIFSAWSRVEMAGNETDGFRVGVAWDDPETRIVVTERLLHALDIRT